MGNPDPRNVELCTTLARLQAIVAEDRVTGEDDDCIAACGIIMNYLANDWGMDQPWLWDGMDGMHNLEGADAEYVARCKADAADMQARAKATVAMLLATGEAPTVMRSRATSAFVDLARQDGIDAQIPGQPEMGEEDAR